MKNVLLALTCGLLGLVNLPAALEGGWLALASLGWCTTFAVLCLIGR
jgi:hypothetical protein